MLMTK